MSRPALEVADIFRNHGPAWRHANRGHISLDQLKVMSAIERCRTAALGALVRTGGFIGIPDDIRGQIVEMALERPELSPRELAVTFTDERKYFVSEASVYRLLKALGLITSPALIVMKAAPSRRRYACLPGNG